MGYYLSDDAAVCVRDLQNGPPLAAGVVSGLRYYNHTFPDWRFIHANVPRL